MAYHYKIPCTGGSSDLWVNRNGGGVTITVNEYHWDSTRIAGIRIPHEEIPKIISELQKCLTKGECDV